MKRMNEYRYFYGLVLRIYPSNRQKNIIKVNDNAARFIYNEMVAVERDIGRFGKRNIYIPFIENRIRFLKEKIATVTALKNRYTWLCNPDIDSECIANARLNYRKAWKRYRDVPGTGIPSFHKKDYTESYQTNPHYKPHKPVSLFTSNVRFLDRHHITLPKLQRIRCQGSPKILAKLFRMETVKIGTITIRKDACDRYYASLLLASDEPFYDAVPKTGTSIGIDLNLENFYVDSDGNVKENPRYYRKQKKRLANAQNKLSHRIEIAKKENRAIRVAKNIQKQRRIVAKLSSDIMRRRRDFLHRESLLLIKNHDVIIAEDLRSQNLVRNHRVALSIQDSGWRSFLSMLEYKAKCYGKTFMMVNPRNTTQTCHVCNHVLQGDDKLTLDDRQWICPVCGTHHKRDLNAARNILAKGLRQFKEA